MIRPQLIFFEKSPFMSVELLDILEDYKIICYNDDTVYRNLKNSYNLTSYANTDLTVSLDNDKAIEIILNDSKFLSDTISEKERSYSLFFFMNENIDRLVRDFGITPVLPPYSVQEELGNKLNLASICSALDLPYNQTLVFRTETLDMTASFLACKKELGIPFVLQGSIGVSGEDTFLIDSEQAFSKHVQSIRNEFKATKFLKNNIPVSVHVCITENDILINGPFLQIIGFPELASNPFQFSGNDTNQSLFSPSFIKKIKEVTLQLSQYAKMSGYKGILGIDYLWDKDTDTIYIQELNTRLVGLTRLLTGIQKDQRLTPDILKHLQAFDSFNLRKNIPDFHEGNLDFSNIHYSQLLISNNSSESVTISKYLEPGKYQLNEGLIVKTSDSLFVHDMSTDSILVTYSAFQGKKLSPNGIVVKIILKDSVLDDNSYRLKPKFKEMISVIKDYILTP